MSEGKNRFIVPVVMIVIIFFIAVYVFLALRGDGEYDTIEQEGEVETIPVTDGDAVSELYRALGIVLSDTADDMESAVEALSRSADLGNSDAMYFLGELYFQGIGVEADMEKAGMYFRQSCEYGNRKAMSLYGKMLFMGEGAEQDYDESASYFYTLSGDDAEASYILGVMSNLGIGVPRSAECAAKYISQAADAGYGKAESYRDKIQDMGSIDGTDDFVLQAKQVQELDYETEYNDLQTRIDQYYGIMKATENYSAFEEEITGLLDVDMNGISAVTLFGNNGYLFHQNENDGTPLHDYIGDNHFTQEEMAAVAAKLEKEKQWVEQNGAQFVLLLIPNKETMYPEWMPSYINRADTTTREDLFVEYLREHTDIHVIYVKDTLLQNKELYPLYYKTDTHANMVGSLFMVSDLLKGCYNVEIKPDLDQFDIHMQDYMGDLGTMAKCTDRYAADTVYFYPGSAVGDEEKINSSMMLVGDSFSVFINIETSYYLKGGVDHRMIAEYDYDYHNAAQAGFAASEKPEYVVWECVERNLERLK